MKLTRITQYMTQVTFLGLCNCYLVKIDDGLLLVDCTIPRKAREIMEAARELVGQISGVALTHAHMDHIGSLDELNHLNGGLDTVTISAREARLLHKDFSMEPGEPQQKPKGTFTGARTKPTKLVRHGDRVGPLEVIDSPGHTPGHVCYLDTRDGTLIAGDALLAFGELKLITDAPWFFPFPKVATWDAPTAIASARRLLDYKPARIVCGHGTEPVEDGMAALEAAVHAAER